jgi:hypothetical protein
MLYDIKLIRCGTGNKEYQKIRDRHYIPNRGCIGQQIHYLIYLDTLVIGIISGASATYMVKSRDDYFGINNENRNIALNSIINNNIFRLELHQKNLATQILKLWRNKISKDWEKKYKIKVAGFETFVLEVEHRKGTVYKADNWIYLGKTKGQSKIHNHGIGNIRETKKVEPKLIYAIKTNNKICSEYKGTWNHKKQNYELF